MIAGIGTDIVKIASMEAIIQRHGDRFARRILLDSEFACYQQSSAPAAFLAKRFAAKEAAAKALGTGIGKVAFQHLEVSNNEKGAPLLAFHGYAAVLQKERDIRHCHLTLSDEADNAVAFVVLEAGCNCST